jgi:glycosyltransferase involved in cell wall biosynthesis
MLGEGGPFLAEAKRRGLRVVSEVFILLSTERILAEERKRFADWEPDVPDYEALRRELKSENALLTCSNFFVCPSEAVRDDLVANWGVERSRSVVVPYGVNPEWLQMTPRPVRGRVLFAGTAELRKGIHYFAKAAEDLKSRGYVYDFRVAGSVTPRIAQRSETRHLSFLGRIPRHKIGEEFLAADVFVLPSLAEGSAEVTYEALAAGLPVVTTAAAGSVVRDGVEGFIVRERDPTALAEAIARIVEDRGLRERMSKAARSRARDYTSDCYGERLIVALKQLV